MKNTRTRKTKHNGMSEESEKLAQKLVMMQQKDAKKKKQYPSWIYVDDNNKKKVIPSKLGDAILNKTHFLLVENDDKESLYEYDSTKRTWSMKPKGSIKSIIHKYLVSQNIWMQNTEYQTYQYILGGIKRAGFKYTFGKDPALAFNFKNGVWNWKTMKLERKKHPDNPEYYSKYYFLTVTDYPLITQKAKTPETDKYFKLVFGENAQTVKEFIGYSFYPSYKPIQAIMILKGDGGDGKSTFMNFCRNLVGKDNASSVSLRDLGSGKENNFKIVELYHKFLNTSSELSDSSNKPLDTAMLKLLSGGDEHSASDKGKNDKQFDNFAKLLIATNELVTFRDSSKGWKRRIFVVNFHHIDNYTKIINWDAIRKERGTFIYKCILLAKKAIEKKDLTITSSIKQQRKEWILDNDIIQEFLDECCNVSKTETANKDDLFSAYRNWCFDNGFKPYSINKFNKKLRDKGITYDSSYLTDATATNKSKRKRHYYYSGASLNEYANPVSRTNPVVNFTSKSCKP